MKMTEIDAFPIPERCRRCPTLREERYRLTDLIRSRQRDTAFAATLIGGQGLDDSISSQLGRYGIDDKGAGLGPLRQSMGTRINEFEVAEQEIVQAAIAGTLSCVDGADITEGVKDGQRHVLSRCTSPEYVSAGLGLTDYDIMPADVDWISTRV